MTVAGVALATGPLNEIERQRLAHEEASIETGAAQIGRALMTIRDQRLYREAYRTFEDYCQERWGMTPRHANRQVAAAKVAELVGPIGPTPREGQARELAPLLDDPDLLVTVWETAVAEADGKPTAAIIREVRERFADDSTAMPAEPRRPAPRRAPLPDSYLRSLVALKAKANALTKLTNDDRWNANRAVVTGRHGSDALNVLLNISAAVAQLDPATLAEREEARQWWLASLNQIAEVLTDFGNTLKECSND